MAHVPVGSASNIEAIDIRKSPLGRTVSYGADAESTEPIEDTEQMSTSPLAGSTSSPTSTAEITPQLNSHSADNKIYLCYILLIVFAASMHPLTGVLFSSLLQQLNISEVAMASIFASRSIAYCISSIVTAVVVDKYVESHRFAALCCFVGSIAFSLVAFVDSLPAQYVLWIFIGTAGGLADVAAPVFAFRAFTSDTQNKWLALNIAAGITRMMPPLINQLSVSLTGEYSYFMFVMAVAPVSVGVLLLFLPTPRHNELRGIEKAMDKSPDSLRSAQSVQQEMNKPRIKTLRMAIVILLGFILVLFVALRIGMGLFIILYVTQHLNGPEEIGNYLISAHYAGDVLFRVVVGRCFSDSLKHKAHSTWSLLLGYVVFFVLLALWTFARDVSYELQVAVLFIVFGFSGIASSTTFPAVYELCETVQPITGVLGGAFTLGLGVGDFITVLVMGELVEAFGVAVQPVPLLTVCGVQVVVVVTATVLYQKFRAYEAAVLAANPKYRDQPLDEAASIGFATSSIR